VKILKAIFRHHFSLLLFVSTLFVSSSLNAGVPLGENALLAINATSLSDNRVQLQFNLRQPLGKVPNHFMVKEPIPRIVLDFPNTINQLKKKKSDIGLGKLHSYTTVSAGDRTRVVLDLKDDVDYTVNTRGDRVFVTLGGISQVSQVKSTLHASKKVVSEHLKKYQIKKVDFRRDKDGGGRVIVSLSDQAAGVTVVELGNKVVAKFVGGVLPKRLQKRYDVVDFSTPVEFVSVSRASDGAELSVLMHQPYQYFAYQLDDRFIVDIKPINEQQIKLRKPTYSGKRLSLNFQDVSVRAVLQVLAEFTGINIVVTDTVFLHPLQLSQTVD